MAEIKITIPTAQVERVKNAFLSGAMEQEEPADVKAFVKGEILNFIKQKVASHERQQAISAIECTIDDELVN